jgi:hypothetical protein
LVIHANLGFGLLGAFGLECISSNGETARRTRLE